MKRVPQATVLPSGDLRLEFPFDRPFIEALKVLIPHHARTYDPETNGWHVDEPYMEWAIDLFRQYFPNGRIDRGELPRESGLSPAYSVLHLRPDAPPELVAGAYRILAKVHHPDRGGNAERMRQINAAIALLREQVAS